MTDSVQNLKKEGKNVKQTMIKTRTQKVKKDVSFPGQFNSTYKLSAIRPLQATNGQSYFTGKRKELIYFPVVTKMERELSKVHDPS